MNIIPAPTKQTRSECYSFLGRVHMYCSHGMSNDVTYHAVVPDSNLRCHKGVYCVVQTSGVL